MAKRRRKSIAQASFQYSGLYEAELLVELMLRYWKHPLADDEVFRQDLLENAAEVLRLAISGTSLIEGLAAKNVNFVAAVWMAEWSAMDRPEGVNPQELQERRNWLDAVRHAVPSCFCDPTLLE